LDDGVFDSSGFDPTDFDRLERRLEELRARHRELDDEIRSVEQDGGLNLRVMALKREKLRVKDQIAWITARLTPDIIA
jgi:hypothetical protein